MQNWKEEALRLYAAGESGRSIAEKLGKGKSTINDFLRLAKEEYKDSLEGSSTKNVLKNIQENSYSPRVLFLDIETKPIIAQVWQLWDNNVALNQIQEDWSILAWCAKWWGDEEVVYEDLRDAEDLDDDSRILGNFWNLLNEADFVIGHNCKSFDTKKINARLILNGYPKPSPYRQIDTLEIAKREFGFTSNRLEYLTNKLCKKRKKLLHNEFPGHMLWVECLKGNPLAWNAMKEYNIEDVLSLEELYNVLAPWDSKHPNFDAYLEGAFPSDEWKKAGFAYTNLGKYQRYQNKTTGVYKRSGVNLLSKEKRASLLRNI